MVLINYSSFEDLKNYHGGLNRFLAQSKGRIRLRFIKIFDQIWISGVRKRN